MSLPDAGASRSMKTPRGEVAANFQRAVLWNSVLWTAGQALTSSSFVSYFAQELQMRAMGLAMVLALPDLFGMAAVTVRGWLPQVGPPKRSWLIASILARCCTLGIPLAGLLANFPVESRQWLLIVAVISAAAAQSIATATYFVWLANEVPEIRWGRFFARRNLAILGVQLVVPLLASLLRDSWRQEMKAKQLANADFLAAYVVVFTMGVGLLLLSMLPMLRLPQSSASTVDGPLKPNLSPGESTISILRRMLKNHSLQWLLLHGWCLGLGNGLTQAVFAVYVFRELRLPLTTWLLMQNLMWLLQMPWTAWAGRRSDANDDRTPLFVGTLLAGCALPFWMLASRESPIWLWGAYVCWSGFGAVNVAGPNLLLKLSPRDDHGLHQVLFRQGAGVCAGIAGLLGACILEMAPSRPISLVLGGPSWTIFQWLFCVSGVGRLCAAILVLPIRPASLNSVCDNSPHPKADVTTEVRLEESGGELLEKNRLTT